MSGYLSLELAVIRAKGKDLEVTSIKMVTEGPVLRRMLR